jgi:hypothetical protein
VLPAVEQQRAAEDLRVAAELRLPQAVAQDDDVTLAGLALLGREGAAEERRAELRQEARRHQDRRQVPGAVGAGERQPEPAVGAEVLEASEGVGEVDEVGAGEARAVDALARLGGVEAHQLLGLGIRQGLE